MLEVTVSTICECYVDNPIVRLGCGLWQALYSSDTFPLESKDRPQRNWQNGDKNYTYDVGICQSPNTVHARLCRAVSCTTRTLGCCHWQANSSLLIKWLANRWPSRVIFRSADWEILHIRHVKNPELKTKVAPPNKLAQLWKDILNSTRVGSDRQWPNQWWERTTYRTTIHSKESAW